MPGAADILLLVGLLAQFEDLRVIRQALDKRVIGRLGEVPRETQHVGGAELLVAHIDRKVVEEGVVDLRPGLVAEGLAQIDAANLGAESAGEGTDRDRLVIHGVLLRLLARPKPMPSYARRSISVDHQQRMASVIARQSHTT